MAVVGVVAVVGLQGCGDDEADGGAPTTSTPSSEAAAELAIRLEVDEAEAAAILDSFCVAAQSGDPGPAADQVRALGPAHAAAVGEVLLAITTQAQAQCPGASGELPYVADDVYTALTEELDPGPEGQGTTMPAPTTAPPSATP